MFDPRPLCCSSLTTAVGGTKDTNFVDSESPYRGTNQAPGFKDFCHIPLGPCSGFKAKHCNFLLFLFLFVFIFLFFFFLRHIGLLFMGVLNLIKVVNETSVGFAKSRRSGSFSAY